MFDITLQAENGEQEIWSYDPINGELYDQAGKLLFFKSRYSLKAPQISPSDPGTKGGILDTLKIQLGLKCNLSCTYCLQGGHIEEAKNTNLDDAHSFLENLDSWVLNEPNRVEFWGGEPLLYWKKLKVLIPALREKFPKAVFLLITNGTLLTDEVADYAGRYDLSIAVSHDAQGQSNRGQDPLENPEVARVCQRLVNERPWNFSFNAVITNKNMNLTEVVGYFKTRFGAQCNVSFEGIVSYYDASFIDKVRLSEEELKVISNEIFYGLSNGLLNGSSFRMKLEQTLSDMINPIHIKSRYSKCGMDRADKIAVDLQGNVTTCQNTGPSGKHDCGNVKELQKVEVKSSTHFMKRQYCPTCPMVRVCGGGCMYLHGNDFEETCRADYAQAWGIFRAAIYKITGKVATKIEVKEIENKIPTVMVD